MFYSATWDPLLIISQICVMQCSFYLSTGLFLHVFDFLSGRSISVAQFFSDVDLSVWTLHGWMTVLAFVCGGVLGYDHTTTNRSRASSLRQG